jgi:hypothetical protein
LSPAIVAEPVSRQHARVFEPGKELGDRGGRDGRAARELGAHDLPVTDRLQRQVLRNSKGRLVRSEQALDPAAHERRDADERLRGLTIGGMVAWPWQYLSLLYCLACLRTRS